MRSFGKLDHPAEHVLGVYFHQCAIAMNCIQLARAGLFLANGGTSPLTGHSVVSRQRAKRINALMLTCGHYDGSGISPTMSVFPARAVSGRDSGGRARQGVDRRLVAGLNQNGNSLLGSLALEKLASRTGWSVFGAEHHRFAVKRLTFDICT